MNTYMNGGKPGGGRQVAQWAVLLVAAAFGLATGSAGPANLSLANVVGADGSVRFRATDGRTCGGWQLTLDPGLRARFVDSDGELESCPGSVVRSASSYWDDELIVGNSRFQIRTMAVSQDETYVTGRFQLDVLDTAVSGILRWSATTGRWHVVSSTTRTIQR